MAFIRCFYLMMSLFFAPSFGLLGKKTEKENTTLYEADNGFLCQKCKRGYYLLKACDTDHGPSTCQACPKETFMDKANRYQECAECRICHGGQETIAECSSVSNRVCQCPTGKYWVGIPGYDGWCDFHSICKNGTVVVTPGTAWADTVCGNKSTKIIISTFVDTDQSMDVRDQNPPKYSVENSPQDNNTGRVLYVLVMVLSPIVVIFSVALWNWWKSGQRKKACRFFKVQSN